MSQLLGNCRLSIRYFCFPSFRSMSSKLSHSPHPNWSVGENQPHPFGDGVDHIAFDPLKLKSCYNLLISGVAPRPVAFVSTISNDNIVNLAPFSYFNCVAHDPPTVCIGICKKRNAGNKDTLNNILETKEFVVNIISDWMVESSNLTCGDFDPDVDEMKLAGFKPLPSINIKPPRVAESAFHMECKLTMCQDIVNDSGEVTTTIVFGRVIMFHVLSPLVEMNPRGIPQVSSEQYRPMGRLGGDTWVECGSQYDMRRPNASDFVPSAKP